MVSRTDSDGLTTMTTYQQKITFGEMRESGPTRLLVYCGDYKCAHSVVVDAGRWGDDVRLSDLEPKFTCEVCWHRGTISGLSLSQRTWERVHVEQVMMPRRT
jgi:hypothetical protein